MGMKPSTSMYQSAVDAGATHFVRDIVFGGKLSVKITFSKDDSSEKKVGKFMGALSVVTGKEETPAEGEPPSEGGGEETPSEGESPSEGGGEETPAKMEEKHPHLNVQLEKSVLQDQNQPGRILMNSA